ncbi:MAG: hypothetical protein AAGH92_04990 [Planctomycetota bacterium]
MALAERQQMYRELEAHRKRPLITYVTSKRLGVGASMATDSLPWLIDTLDRVPHGDSIDFLIASYGGDPMVAWRIMSLLRQRFKHVSVLIPQTAFSAATLLALGADEIVMHRNSHLGPVDMQIDVQGEIGRQRFSTEDIGAFIEYIKTELGVTDQEHLRRLFETTIREVGTLGVGFTARSSKLAVDLGEKMLRMHLRDGEDDSGCKALVEKLSRQFHSHAYPVSRTEAIEIGLEVKKEEDEIESDLMWRIWLDLEADLKERQPFSPIIELMNSSCAEHVASAPPQLALAENAGVSYTAASIQETQQASQSIEPVEYGYINAMIETHETAFSSVTKGKILASRKPDLEVQWNALTSFHGWISSNQPSGEIK